ncbi:hypothetical protein LSTR_LSTR009786 [Laodelphax striatellus]|uniref:DUF4789 domain-containing protein n=1 Tax=Laodelphax striatellus TaxID=195883 RepID=A0A482XME3_LAOST|nr:hypothetical protein LSTR_LSTR009786 [Laodelphax striatellus]
MVSSTVLILSSVAIIFSDAQSSGNSELVFFRRAMRKSSSDSDAIIFPDDALLKLKPPTFSKQERNCFVENHVYFNNSCQELNKRGSCGDNEVLIIDLKPAQQNPPKFRPKCVPRQCASNEFFWPQTNTCHTAVDNVKLCGDSSKVLSTDIFGLGFCKCIAVPVHAEHKDGKCYEIYRQGPCKPGQLFTVKNSDDTECTANRCQNKSLVYHEQTAKCYSLGETGPCTGQFKLLVSSNTKRPECVEDMVGLTVSVPVQNCYGDNNNKCIPSDSVESQDEKYIMTLLKAVANRKK